MLMHEFVPHVSALDVAKSCSGNCPTVLCDSVSESEVSVCERSAVLLDPGNVVMTFWSGVHSKRLITYWS